MPATIAPGILVNTDEYVIYEPLEEAQNLLP